MELKQEPVKVALPGLLVQNREGNARVLGGPLQLRNLSRGRVRVAVPSIEHVDRPVEGVASNGSFVRPQYSLTLAVPVALVVPRTVPQAELSVDKRCRYLVVRISHGFSGFRPLNRSVSFLGYAEVFANIVEIQKALFLLRFD